MAIWQGKQEIKPVININQKILQEYRGELDEKDAIISLAKFLRYNVGFAAKLLIGIDLEPIQEMHLNAMFRKNNTMFVWSRGAGKTSVAAFYIILKCIFEPDTRVVIASANFRTSRRLFEEIEKFLKRPEAALARQCFNRDPSKKTDSFTWNVNGGVIIAIPLTEETRGMRCDLLVLDEVLLLSQKIIHEVLGPFLSSPRDSSFRIKIKKLEKELIEHNLLSSEQKMIFENTSQMIVLSSAGYQFQYLYKMYQEWLNIIEDPNRINMSDDNLIDQESSLSSYIEKKDADDKFLHKDEETPTYFISQLSWEAIPSTILNRNFIKSQKAVLSEDAFSREYEAQFRDGSDGYFSMKKMDLCTIPDGQKPHSIVMGDPGKKYILSIDPSYSKSESSDFFAMSVIELDEKNKEGILVHGYQKAGGDQQDHVKYIYYVLTNFNIVLIIGDSMLLDTITDSCNDNELFKINLKKKITYLDKWDSDKEGQEYIDMAKEVNSQYDVNLGCFCIKQYPSVKWIMTANSYLQSCIDHRKIWFASRASNFPDYIDFMFFQSLPMELIYPKGFGTKCDTNTETTKLSIRDFIEIQDDIIWDTKMQCASIEQTSTARGQQNFDLPRGARSSNSPNRIRKDNYSSLLLGNWGIKCYFDIIGTSKEIKRWSYTPVLI